MRWPGERRRVVKQTTIRDIIDASQHVIRFRQTTHPVNRAVDGPEHLVGIGNMRARWGVEAAELVGVENDALIGIVAKPVRVDAVSDNATHSAASKHPFASSFAPDAQCQQMRVIEILVRNGFHYCTVTVIVTALGGAMIAAEASFESADSPPGPTAVTA